MSAPAVETSIMQAVRARVATIPLGYAIIWTNDGTVDLPSSGGLPAPYIEAHFEPNQNIRPFVGSRDTTERPSILLITLCWPVANVGAAGGKMPVDAIRQMAANIVQHFSTDKTLAFHGVKTRVTRMPDLRASYRDDAYLRTQVSIPMETQR